MTPNGPGARHSLDAPAPGGMTIDSRTGLISYTPSRGPYQTTAIVRVTDNGTPAKSATRTFVLTVRDVAPVVTVGGRRLSDAGGLPSGPSRPVHRSRAREPGWRRWITATGRACSPLALNPDKSFVMSHAYASPGRFIAVVRVTDSGGATGIGSFGVDVAPLPKPGILGFSSTSGVVGERGGAITFIVNRTGGADGTVSIHYATSDGSAVAGLRLRGDLRESSPSLPVRRPGASRSRSSMRAFSRATRPLLSPLLPDGGSVAGTGRDRFRHGP